MIRFLQTIPATTIINLGKFESLIKSSIDESLGGFLKINKLNNRIKRVGFTCLKKLLNIDLFKGLLLLGNPSKKPISLSYCLFKLLFGPIIKSLSANTLLVLPESLGKRQFLPSNSLVSILDLVLTEDNFVLWIVPCIRGSHLYKFKIDLINNGCRVHGFCSDCEADS